MSITMMYSWFEENPDLSKFEFIKMFMKLSDIYRNFTKILLVFQGGTEFRKNQTNTAWLTSQSFPGLQLIKLKNTKTEGTVLSVL